MQLHNRKKTPNKRVFYPGSRVSAGGQQGRSQAMTKPGGLRTAISAKGSQPRTMGKGAGEAGRVLADKAAQANAGIRPLVRPRVPVKPLAAPVLPGPDANAVPVFDAAAKDVGHFRKPEGGFVFRNEAGAVSDAPDYKGVHDDGFFFDPAAGAQNKMKGSDPTGSWMFQNEHGNKALAMAPEAHEQVFGSRTPPRPAGVKRPMVKPADPVATAGMGLPLSDRRPAPVGPGVSPIKGPMRPLLPPGVTAAAGARPTMFDAQGRPMTHKQWKAAGSPKPKGQPRINRKYR